MPRIQGLARCTAYDPPAEVLSGNKTLGPDNGWVLLSAKDVLHFCSGEGKNLIHRGKSHYDHVCASYGEWAFDAEDSSYIRCVVFLHYKTPKKVAKFLGDVDSDSGAKVFNFSGEEFYNTYTEMLASEKGEAHVWKRAAHGEIAIDFCMTKSKKRINNPKGRIELPDFIPR